MFKSKALYRIPVLMLLMLFGSAWQVPKEYQVKAAFIYNFTQFVTWPETTGAEQSAFVIGVVGTNPFGTYLEETVKDERVHDRPLVVKYFANAEAVGPCQILFINLSDKAAIKKVMDKIKDQHVLTVCDVQSVEKGGGIIRFINEQQKTKLRINVTAARDAGITISSKLLNLAEITE